MVLTLLFVVYCLEAGIFFIVAPWTRFWVHHPLLHLTPVIASLADNSFVRGLVSGFGVVHVIVAIHEVQQYFFRRRRS